VTPLLVITGTCDTKRLMFSNFCKHDRNCLLIDIGGEAAAQMAGFGTCWSASAKLARQETGHLPLPFAGSRISSTSNFF